LKNNDIENELNSSEWGASHKIMDPRVRDYKPEIDPPSDKSLKNTPEYNYLMKTVVNINLAQSSSGSLPPLPVSNKPTHVTEAPGKLMGNYQMMVSSTDTPNFKIICKK
jgi:hypothetical protein